MAAIAVGLGLLCLVALVAYAIYRADKDPVFPDPRRREFKQVRWDQVQAYIREGWKIADEDDQEEPGWVLLDRIIPDHAPPEPERAPPNAHRWTDVH